MIHTYLPKEEVALELLSYGRRTKSGRSLKFNNCFQF